MLTIQDEHLPGLARLTQDQLRAITGADDVDLLRLRYRAGNRAILHVAARRGATVNEGTLWFFKGDKAKRLARRNKPHARFDPKARALFEAFPNDHRMPQIRDFLARYDTILQTMTGQTPDGVPDLLRYRPGLSCTFRCNVDGRADVFVKLINDDDPARLCAANQDMRSTLAGTGVSVVAALGIDRSVRAIAYDRAGGTPLDDILQGCLDLGPLRRAIAALGAFWAAPITPVRQMGPDALLFRAQESAAFVAVTAPACARATAALADTLAQTAPQADLRPTHGDIKLEHIFLDPDHVTLIDTESVAWGLPDYDLAQLFGRLWQAELEGQLPGTFVQAASAEVAGRAGPHFDWCRGIVGLRLAKFYAQRPGPDTERSIAAILDRVT